MSDWTCERVEDCIDLYAAGEADAPTRAAVGRHLTACPSCTESHRQAQQVLGLLDQQFQESERLQRLWSRLKAEPKRAARPVRVVLWRAAALAASVLVTLGLSGWLGPGQPDDAGPQFAAVLRPPAAGFAPGSAPAMMVRSDSPKGFDAAPPAAKEAAAPNYPLDLGGKTPAEFRREVRAAAGTDRLPAPPAVDLTLEVRNGGREVLPLRFGDDRTKLVLDLQGPGVLDVPAPDAAAPLARLGVVRIAPGETYRLPIHQLAYGSHDAVHYLYWMEPGEYTLTITLRVEMEAAPLAGAREVVTIAGPMHLHVRQGP